MNNAASAEIKAVNTPPEVPTRSCWITIFLFIAFILGVVVADVAANEVASSEVRVVVALWLSGAAALGLLSGYTTGASDQTGTASEFLKFVSGGVLVPLLGGAAGLVQGSEKASESYSYLDGQLVEKVTATSGPLHATVFHPLAVL